MHDARGVAEESAPVLGAQFPHTNKSQIRLAHERDRIKQCVATAIAQPRAHESAQLAVGGRKQRIARLGVAGLHLLQQLGDLRDVGAPPGC